MGYTEESSVADKHVLYYLAKSEHNVQSYEEGQAMKATLKQTVNGMSFEDVTHHYCLAQLAQRCPKTCVCVCVSSLSSMCIYVDILAYASLFSHSLSISSAPLIIQSVTGPPQSRFYLGGGLFSALK